MKEALKKKKLLGKVDKEKIVPALDDPAQMERIDKTAKFVQKAKDPPAAHNSK